MNHEGAHSTVQEAEADSRYAVIRENLSRAVARVCPPWLRDHQDDLIQVAVLRVMDIDRRQDSSEGVRHYSSSYLYRVAYSAMIDEIRRVRRRDETPFEAPVDAGEPEARSSHPVADTTMTPENLSAAAEEGRAIRDCLQRLIPPRRAAVTLYLAGHSVPEGARILEWTTKKMENLVYRGLADLRQCLLRKGIKR